MLVCPACSAELPADTVERTESAACPFCGAALPAESGGIQNGNAPEITGQTAEPSAGAGPPPAGSKIQVAEESADHVILHIRGGGAAATGLGCFALAWNLFMVVFTAVFGAVALGGGGGNNAPGWFVVPILLLFWAAGLGMLYFYLKLKYERTLLLVERDSIAIKKIFFSRQRIERTALSDQSRAVLREAYSQNDQPVYRVEVDGHDRTVRFGTGLDQKEKDWLVDKINAFLGVPPVGDEAFASSAASAAREFPESCAKCAAPLAGAPVDGVLRCEHCGAVHRGSAPAAQAGPHEPADEPMTADSLPAGSGVQIEEATPERLQFSFRAGPGALRWVVGPFALVFAGVWYGGLLFAMGDMHAKAFGAWNVVILLFKVPFLIAGLLPVALGLYFLFGRTLVTLTRSVLTVRWGVGPVGYSRSVATEQIESVALDALGDARKNPRVRMRPSAANMDDRCCVVRNTAGKMLPVTLFADSTLQRHALALLRTRLAEMGLPQRAG